jgi:HD-like signal output (HDOD) protein
MFSRLPFARPTPEALVRRLKNLPPAPKVLHRLQRLLVTPDASIDQIAAVVKMEPGLAARMVKMAQSTEFGRGARVDSIDEAVQRVGLTGVHELVTYAVAAALVGQPLHTYKLNAQLLWSRAIACALAAASLAERAGLSRCDAYTAGLMHGIGLLVIDRHSASQRTPHVLISSGYPLDFSPAEQEWLGFNHADAGAALLEMWGFSEPVITAVRWQLTPEKAATHRQLSMILATARWARSLFCVPEETIPELPSTVWLEESGVEIDDFGTWLDEVRRGYALACDEMRLG